MCCKHGEGCRCFWRKHQYGTICSAFCQHQRNRLSWHHRLNTCNTKAEWQLGAANDASIIKEEGNVATISYARGGTKDIKLTLSNAWGVDSISKAGIVEVDGSSSIKDIHANDLAITPYTKSVNFRFVESAHYSILIISPAGIMMQRAEIDAHEGQLVNVALHDGNGTYIVQVMQDNKVYKSVKVACK